LRLLPLRTSATLPSRTSTLILLPRARSQNRRRTTPSTTFLSPIRRKHFKEKFIPSIYDWAGSRAVSQPFSTTGHPDLKATITDLWCNSVFKHLTPLDTNGTRRVDNAAVLAVSTDLQIFANPTQRDLKDGSRKHERDLRQVVHN
ncbi:hypothetical protein BDZ89DRAFT_1163846, partial [Hymenopellis radicata]